MGLQRYHQSADIAKYIKRAYEACNKLNTDTAVQIFGVPASSPFLSADIKSLSDVLVYTPVVKFEPASPDNTPVVLDFVTESSMIACDCFVRAHGLYNFKRTIIELKALFLLIVGICFQSIILAASALVCLFFIHEDNGPWYQDISNKYKKMAGSDCVFIVAVYFIVWFIITSLISEWILSIALITLFVSVSFVVLNWYM